MSEFVSSDLPASQVNCSVYDGAGPVMIFFFFCSQLDHSCLQTSFVIGFIDCSSSISPSASFLVCLSVKLVSERGGWGYVHALYFLPFVPLTTLILPFPLQWLLSSPFLPSLRTTLTKLGWKQPVHLGLLTDGTWVWCHWRALSQWLFTGVVQQFHLFHECGDWVVFFCFAYQLPRLRTMKRKKKFILNRVPCLTQASASY